VRGRQKRDRTEVVDFRIHAEGPFDPFTFRSPDPKLQTAALCFYDWWVTNPDKHFDGPADIRVVYTWYGPKNEDILYDVFKWLPKKY
jgi:hypothetical protein